MRASEQCVILRTFKLSFYEYQFCDTNEEIILGVIYLNPCKSFIKHNIKHGIHCSYPNPWPNKGSALRANVS